MKLLSSAMIKFTTIVERKDIEPLKIGVAIKLEEGMLFDQVQMTMTSASQALESRLLGDRNIRKQVLEVNCTHSIEDRLDDMKNLSGETPAVLEFGD